MILAAGAKGKRYALPHSTILMHQPSGGARGQSADIEIQAREILRLRSLLDEILSKHTGQTVEKISKDTDRDFILSAPQALEYGVVDEIITARQIVPVIGSTTVPEGSPARRATARPSRRPHRPPPRYSSHRSWCHSCCDGRWRRASGDGGRVTTLEDLVRLRRARDPDGPRLRGAA